MALSPRTSAILGAAAGVLLALFEFETAVSGAGPYVEVPGVKLGTIVGAALSYAALLALVGFAAGHARSIRNKLLRRAVFFVLTLAGAAGTLMAPLLAAGVIAVGCKTETFCPSVTNPVVWSYLALVTRLPWSPLAAGLLIVAIVANTNAVLLGDANEV